MRKAFNQKKGDPGKKSSQCSAEGARCRGVRKNHLSVAGYLTAGVPLRQDPGGEERAISERQMMIKPKEASGVSDWGDA